MIRRILAAMLVAAGWGILVYELGLSSVLLVWGAGAIGLLFTIGLEPPRRRRRKIANRGDGRAPSAPSKSPSLVTTHFSRADIPSGGEAVRGCADRPAGRPSSNPRRIK